MTLPGPFVGPTNIRTEIYLPGTAGMDSILDTLAKTLQGYPRISVISWTMDRDARETPGSMADLRAALGARPEPSTLVLNLDARGMNWILIQRHETGLTLSCDSGVEPDETEVREALSVQPAILRAFCKRPDILGGHLLRNANCYVPTAPEGWDAFPMRIVSRQAVEEGYQDPRIYWHSWDRHEELGDDRVLVTRALELLDERAYKRAVYPRIWTLLYSARPGKSRHFDVADLWPGDLDHFEAGEPRLRQAGYSAAEQSLEFTAVVPPGEHLHPREIMVLARYRSDGRLPTGEPLQRVKVTFVDTVMTRREMRPLLDAGIEVWCYAPDATLVRVTD